MVYLKRDRDELRPIISPTLGSGRQPGFSKVLISSPPRCLGYCCDSRKTGTTFVLRRPYINASH